MLLLWTAIENDEDIRVLEAEISELIRQNSVEESHLDTLRRDIATMEEKLAQQDSDLASIEAASNAANSSLAELRAVLAERLRVAGLLDADGSNTEVADDVDAYIVKHLTACQQKDETASVVIAAIREALAGVILH